MKLIILTIVLAAHNLNAQNLVTKSETMKNEKKSALTSNSQPRTYDFLQEDWRMSVEQKIRNEIESSKDFSAKAKKIKITVIDDQILLRGQVQDFMEVEKILSLVGELEPSYYIYNQLTTK